MCFAAGWTYKYINRQAVLIGLITIHSLSIALIPFCGSIWVLYGVVVFNGIGGGSWDSSDSVWLVEMWPKANSFSIQISEFVYGVGNIVGPLLVGPYAYGNTTANVTAQDRINSLATPFLVTGALQFITPVLFLVMFFVKRYEPPENRKQMVESFALESADHKKPYSVSMIKYRGLKLTLMAFCLAPYSAFEFAYFYFSPSLWQHLSIHMTPNQAAHVLSVMSTAYTLGRLFTAFISIRVSSDIILAYHYVFIVIGQTMLYVGSDHLSWIYAGTVITGEWFAFPCSCKTIRLTL